MIQTFEELKYIYDSIFDEKNDLLTMDGHLLFRDTGINQYKQLSRKLPSGRTVRIRVHTVILLNKLKLLSMPPSCEASHLCHIKNCISENHINAEPHNVNMERVHCADERGLRRDPSYCKGHGQYPNCIGNKNKCICRSHM